jgi:asparagine synthase (glutamine-hydrolysing)
LPDKFSTKPYESLIIEAEECFLNAGRRVISFLNGRTAMLPLSGGYDSRMIACILKRLGYQNVICFTYGKKTIEVEMSRKVAEALNYKWYYIDYYNIEYKSFTRDAEFKDYITNYSNGYSMFYLQEYFAMRELIKDKRIPADSVFLPGHSGDYIGGSYVEKTAATAVNNHKLAPFLEAKYFFFKRQTGTRQKILHDQISETLKEYPSKNNFSNRYNPYVEDWDVKEKLSKFIFRSSYVFTHFGFEHIFPLWDRQLVAFFRSLPFEFRSGKKLYDKTATEKFFVPLGVSFKDAEIRRSSIYVKYQHLKDKFRDVFPWPIVLKRMIKNDWLNYYGFTQEMEADLILRRHKPLKKYKLFTAIICYWYLDFIGFPKDKY